MSKMELLFHFLALVLSLAAAAATPIPPECVPIERPSDGLAEACGTHVCFRGLNETAQKLILDKHNYLRQLVASGHGTGALNGSTLPPGTIGNLTWDQDLAKGAQIWANHCHFDHDDAVRSVRCNKSPFDTVGQNIGMWTGFMPASYLSLVDFWYGEIKLLDPSNLRPFSVEGSSANALHLTQLLWKKTTKVGCGYVYVILGAGSFNQFLACNYYPAGNYLRRDVY